MTKTTVEPRTLIATATPPLDPNFSRGCATQLSSRTAPDCNSDDLQKSAEPVNFVPTKLPSPRPLILSLSREWSGGDVETKDGDEEREPSAFEYLLASEGGVCRAC